MKFLLILIALVFLAPYISRGIWWIIGQAARKHFEKQSRQMQDAFARAAGLDPDEVRRQQQEQKRAKDHGGWTSPSPKKKKIDPKTGEYVKFKEVSVTETTNESGSYTSVEEQVTDVTWEDID